MWFLFFQIWVWLLAAFILGWVAHWYLCCRNIAKDVESAREPTLEIVSDELSNQTTKPGSIGSTTPDINEQWKPQGLVSQPADLEVDDLKRIKGIGAVIEKTLNGLGIYQFKQIIDWTEDNISWIESFIAFPGRVGRENWIDQANTLVGGETTDFATRVDTGDVDYS